MSNPVTDRVGGGIRGLKMRTYYSIYVNGDFWRAFDTEREAKKYLYEFKKTHHVKTEIIATDGKKSNVGR